MSKFYSRSDLDQLEQRKRGRLINSLAGYKSANLLGSVNAQGQTNLAFMSSVFHIGAQPPLVGVLFRPHSVPRHSLENLTELGEYTLNMVSVEMYQQAHQSTARYPREQSEFSAVGLSEEYSKLLKAPYVAQSPVKTGMKLLETQTLSFNDTVLVIGEIVELHVREGLLGDDGQIDLNAANTVAISGLDEYHSAESLGRMPYAKP